MQKCPPCDLGVEETVFDAGEIGSRNPRTAAPAPRLEKPLQIFMCAEFRSELTRAEIADEISEFFALSFQAVLAIAEGTDFAIDYLEMSEAAAAATSAFESTVVLNIRNAHILARRDPRLAAECCLTVIGQLCQTEPLCRSLLIALARLGDVDAISAVERGLAQQEDSYAARVMESLSLQKQLCGTAVPRILNGRIAG